MSPPAVARARLNALWQGAGRAHASAQAAHFSNSMQGGVGAAPSFMSAREATFFRQAQQFKGAGVHLSINSPLRGCGRSGWARGSELGRAQ
mmetsp:Transcript_15326/g.49245  ORF Transcript_15326/g.49245 Transcript_15326/m.49245 type:complete len:91 (-) Transcript_15326:216-488(-)|eukprot:CAMPEP_0185408308 /NCGR_PEP_ID=MMETSP1365-20130426/1837_1 /TAXON_ID=38817 /ORGANISM="Gephyrocapsa oceanica, Strain RCC1303" /LENGTH=90 /DNA_ID=CAMNT_0028010795 /DNA_START=64 /DNA_END=336 /DNA_ORIENTATION=+